MAFFKNMEYILGDKICSEGKINRIFIYIKLVGSFRLYMLIPEFQLYFRTADLFLCYSCLAEQLSDSIHCLRERGKSSVYLNQTTITGCLDWNSLEKWEIVISILLTGKQNKESLTRGRFPLEE